MAVTDILKRNPTGLARVAHESAARALSNAEARRSKAAADLANAEAAQADAATGDDAAAAGALEAATRRVRDARDLIAAFDDRIIPAARAGLALAESGLDQAERLANCEAAKAKRKAAAARLTRDYPGLAASYAELVAIVQDADDAIAAANANLPAGHAPLETVEAIARDIPAEPVRVVSDRVEPVWHHASGDRVNDPSRVRDGIYRGREGSPIQYVDADRCRQIPKRVVVSIPARPPVHAARLADTPLPPLKPSAPVDAEPVTQHLPVSEAGEAAA
ncbi:hypothetical protein BZG35_03480 [Brevundimonas sp. LM2]|uniref:hypothetical protein n=1 Tax=Brevundimonas sp. LM2 TaxID=1938605 RepID=UPI000983D72B|nr:hypothetical protein [Brevundimonas sp. LM2]AQR60817.1 hypothetical protein BZG35_03480 [Brevundimonas sp. LM2]